MNQPGTLDPRGDKQRPSALPHPGSSGPRRHCTPAVCLGLLSVKAKWDQPGCFDELQKIYRHRVFRWPSALCHPRGHHPQRSNVPGTEPPHPPCLLGPAHWLRWADLAGCEGSAHRAQPLPHPLACHSRTAMLGSVHMHGPPQDTAAPGAQGGATHARGLMHRRPTSTCRQRAVQAGAPGRERLRGACLTHRPWSSPGAPSLTVPCPSAPPNPQVLQKGPENEAYSG